MTAPDNVWIDTFSKTDVGPTWLTKPVWASTEYIRADIAQAQIDQAKAETAAAYAVLAEINGITESSYPNVTSVEDVARIQKLARHTPADAKAALDKMLVDARADALREALAAIAGLKTPMTEDCMMVHEQAYRAVETLTKIGDANA